MGRNCFKFGFQNSLSTTKTYKNEKSAQDDNTNLRTDFLNLRRLNPV